MHSPQDEPPDLPPYPSSPPDHPQPFPGAHAIPVAPDTIIPPNIDDTPTTHSTKRPPDDPPIPPATNARLQPSFMLATIWGVMHSHQSHQMRPHNLL